MRHGYLTSTHMRLVSGKNNSSLVADYQGNSLRGSAERCALELGFTTLDFNLSMVTTTVLVVILLCCSLEAR